MDQQPPISHDQTINAVSGPLMECLIEVVRLHHHPLSAEVLTNGLPLKNGVLTPELFERAAERANIKCKTVKKKLEKIKPNLLPIVAIMANGEGCVITNIKDDSDVDIVIKSGQPPITVPLGAIVGMYSGHMILIKNVADFQQKAEKAGQRKGRSAWFWNVVTDYWPIYGEVMVGSAIINILALASSLFVMNVYDRVVPNGATHTLWVLAVGVFVAFSFDFLLKTLRTYFVDNNARNIDARLSSKIYSHVMNMRMEDRPNSLGGFSHTISAFEAFRDFITSASIITLIDFPFIFLFVGVIYLLGGNLILVPLILIPLILGVSLSLQAPLIKLVKQSFKVSGAKQTALFETLIGMSSIKTNNSQSHMQRSWEEIVCYYAKLNVKIRFISGLATNLSTFLQSLGSIGIIIFGVYKIMDNQLTMGALIACNILVGRALAPIVQASNLLMRYYQSKTGIDGINKIMELENERPVDKVFLHREKIEGHIKFENVSFTYPQAQIPALNGISFSITPGERIGLIGRIGSGKTTIQKLLAGLYRTQAGSVLLDGADIQQYDPIDIRKLIGYIPQDIILFSGTMRANLTMKNPDATDEQIIRAIKLAGLDQLIARNPDGINMQVGERGEMLSGGQRQSIAIAQALLEDPSLLLFDEPTNAMDDITERHFRNMLTQILPGKTLVLVTHKASMLAMVERVIIMDNGNIIADGKKEEVLAALKGKKAKKQADPNANPPGIEGE